MICVKLSFEKLLHDQGKCSSIDCWDCPFWDKGCSNYDKQSRFKVCQAVIPMLIMDPDADIRKLVLDTQHEIKSMEIVDEC